MNWLKEVVRDVPPGVLIAGLGGIFGLAYIFAMAFVAMFRIPLGL